MRVLHLLKTSTGATWALRQIRELVAQGVDVHVALPPGGPLVPAYTAAGAIVHEAQFDLPVTRPALIPSRLAALRTLVQRVRPQVLHSHFVGTTLTMRLALRSDRTPRLFQVPGPLHLEHAFFRQAEVRSATPADHWMGSCQWTCDTYRRLGIDAHRVHLAYYGLDAHAVPGSSGGALRRELGIGPAVPLVGMVAYMYAPKRHLGQRRGLKGHEDLIDAVALLARRLPDVRCVMIGGAWNGADGYERAVRAYARRRSGERVTLLGTRPDAAMLYPEIDVAVHPSHSENVGAAAESLLARVPTVATRVGGLVDLVRDGETGWLVPPRDPERLAEAIAAALANRAEATRRTGAGERLARELLDLRRNTQAVVRAYESMIDATARSAA